MTHDAHTIPMMRSFAEVVVHILHGLHPQASDDEEELGPNVSQVTGPEESAARPSKNTQKQLNTEPYGAKLRIFDTNR